MCRERAKHYLMCRGYSAKDLAKLSKLYDLRYGTLGRWSWRLVVPFYFGGEIIGATGRAIGPARLRYVTAPEGNVTKRILYNYDRCVGKDFVVVTEGPFDALRVDSFFDGTQVGAVATLGTAVTDAQVALLRRLEAEGSRLCLLFDVDAEGPVNDLVTRLIAPTVLRLPSGVNDPAEMEHDDLLCLQRTIEEF